MRCDASDVLGLFVADAAHTVQSIERLYALFV